ncbi:MAG: TRAP transporter small permease [Synergistetes bacterium]|nr:TRAP transporter small permease [Synergistota bacterium]
MNVIRWLDQHLEEFILGLLLVLISCVMLLQVFMRYVVGASLSWAEEFCRYLFVWSSLLSIGYSIREKTILRVDSLVEAMPLRIKRWFRIAIEVVVLVFFLYLFIKAIPVVEMIRKSGQRSPAMEIPMYLVYLSAIVGFFLAVIRSIQSLIEMVKNFYFNNLETEK